MQVIAKLEYGYLSYSPIPSVYIDEHSPFHSSTQKALSITAARRIFRFFKNILYICPMRVHTSDERSRRCITNGLCTTSYTERRRHRRCSRLTQYKTQTRSALHRAYTLLNQSSFLLSTLLREKKNVLHALLLLDVFSMY